MNQETDPPVVHLTLFDRMFNLPAELRNKIIGYVLSNPRGVYVHRVTSTKWRFCDNPVGQGKPRETNQLKYVNRQLRFETYNRVCFLNILKFDGKNAVNDCLEFLGQSTSEFLAEIKRVAVWVPQLAEDTAFGNNSFYQLVEWFEERPDMRCDIRTMMLHAGSEETPRSFIRTGISFEVIFRGIDSLRREDPALLNEFCFWDLQGYLPSVRRVWRENWRARYAFPTNVRIFPGDKYNEAFFGDDTIDSLYANPITMPRSLIRKWYTKGI